MPADSTVVINGNNYVEVNYIAFNTLGSLNFEGTGTLTIKSKDTGVRCVSTSFKDAIRFKSGTYILECTNFGVYSDQASVIFTGAKATITSKYSIAARNIQFLSGSLESKGPIKSFDSIQINAFNLTASSNSSALEYKKELKFANVDISVGANLDNLSPSEEYANENAIKTVSNQVIVKKGILFGGKFSPIVDYLVFIFLILVILAVVLVPIYIKYKKTQRLIQRQKEIEESKNRNKK